MTGVKYRFLRCPYCGSNGLMEREALCAILKVTDRYECLECGLIMVLRKPVRAPQGILKPARGFEE